MRLLGGFLGLCTLLFASPVVAATLYIDPARSEINLGDVQLLQVRLDTDEATGECINAVSGVVQLAGPVTPVDVSLGDSIFPVWLEQPAVDLKTKQVRFAGGVPNGYCGRVEGDPRLTNQLFEIVVRADADQAGETDTIATASFSSDTTAYLNDGAGSVAPLSVLPAQIVVAPTFGSEISDPWVEQVQADTIPPQEFSITLEQDEFAFQGNYFISFNTTDKQTGIDHYEVIEEPIQQLGSFRWGQANAPWRQVRSPYVLNDQSLNSVIRVKAVDKAGNEYIANLIPDESLRTTSLTQVVTYVLVGTVGVALLVAGLVYMNRRRKSVVESVLDIDQSNKPSTYEDQN